MPALQHIRWTDRSGHEHGRLVRSFQISGDDGSLKTRVQYHVGGGASVADPSNWRPALDATTGRELLHTTDYAKVNNVFRSTDGHTVAIDEKAQKDATGRYVLRRSSTDGGVSWSSTRAPIDTTGATVDPGAVGRVFQRVIRLPGDGSLVTPFYAAHARIGDNYLSASHLLVSTTEGRSWSWAATVFKSDTNTYSESSVTRRADGRLVVVARYDVVQNGNRYARLASRTTHAAVDDAASLRAATWGPWTAVKVPGAADPHAAQGVAPVLHTMDNGVLLLAFGRPGNKITASHDGGATWGAAHDLYDNIPTSGCTKGFPTSIGYFPCSSLGSSGYLGVAVTDGRTAYVMGDNCHTNWGCAGDYRYPHGRDAKLWYSTVVFEDIRIAPLYGRACPTECANLLGSA
ncbi:sialidase family protein [Actinosynnema sp. CS-041913]|uniref:sialidase family protein n=1 Tax=Actinosynnema sp. CS-041913 TaxID=3239917 RepID=UPI003D90C305